MDDVNHAMEGLEPFAMRGNLELDKGWMHLKKRPTNPHSTRRLWALSRSC